MRSKFDIIDDANLYTNRGIIDSLDFSELLVSIEKSFNILIDDEQYEKLTTVDSVVKFVQSKVCASESRLAMQRA